MYKILLKLTFLASLACLLSCSASVLTQNEPAPEIKDLQIYYSRASMNSKDFEQFNYQEGVLFSECGRLLKGRHNAMGQNVVSLDSSQKEELNQLAFAAISSKNLDLLQTPGKTSHMFDPGIFTLFVNHESGSKTIETSLDAVSSDPSNAARRLRQLTEFIRTTSLQRLCGNTVFYGIGIEE